MAACCFWFMIAFTFSAVGGQTWDLQCFAGHVSRKRPFQACVFDTSLTEDLIPLVFASPVELRSALSDELGHPLLKRQRILSTLRVSWYTMLGLRSWRCGEKGGICDTIAAIAGFDIKHSALPSMGIESWNVGYDEYITSHILYHIIYYNISYCINLYNMMIKYMVYPYNMYKMPYIHMIYSNWVLFGSKDPSYPERFWRRLLGWNATTQAV